MGMVNKISERRMAKLCEVNAEIKKLEKLQSELKEKVLQDFNDSGVQSHAIEEGTFYINSRKAWKYSAKVKALEEAVKDAKDREQDEGTAKCSESTFLAFRETKE